MASQKLARCLTPAELSACLESVTEPSLAAQDHLGTCSLCQQALDSLVADSDWWQDAEECLSGDHASDEFQAVADRISHSVRAMSGESQATIDLDPNREHELAKLQELLEPASHPELLGRISRYELEQLVGHGGMGLVFRARDIDLHRIVAVKTIAAHLMPAASARQRFIREARACASLIHPHIVAVHDIVTTGAVPAIVMQYVAGPTLQQHLDEHGAMHWKDVLRLGVQLCDALETAHQSGLIHRDIKPGNVMLEAGATRALLTDFGLVRVLDAQTVTRTGTLTGTPEYMSPEQSWGQELDPRSDLFSLGSLLYTMLTGQPPFRAQAPMATLNLICNQPHPPIGNLVADLPVQVSRLVDRLLAKQPKKRFNSAAEVRDHMQQLIRSDVVLRSPIAKRTLWLMGVGCLLLVMIGVFYGVAAVMNRDARRLKAITIAPSVSASPMTTLVMPEHASGFADLKATDAAIGAVGQRLRQLELAVERPDWSRRPLPLPPKSASTSEFEALRKALDRLEQQTDPVQY